MRRTGLVLLSVIIAALGVPRPGSAFAADPSTVINWAGSVQEDPGVLQVSVTSAQEITHLKAHILSPTTGQEVASTEDFVLNSGTAGNGVWNTEDPFQLDQLGSYPVTIDATAADGTEVTAGSIGYLSYYALTVFDPLTSNRATVNYAHRDVTVRGRVMSRAPGTRALTPFADAPIELDFREYDRTGSGTPGWADLRTGADGRFSFTRALKGRTDFDAGYVYRNDIPGQLGGVSDTLRIAVKQSPVRVTAAAVPRRLDAGGRIAVSGQVTWKSPTGWEPLAGAGLYIQAAAPSQYPVTDAGGRYTTTMVPDMSMDIPVLYGSPDPFLADASATAKVIVVQPSLIADFDAVPGVPGTIEVSGTLAFPGAGAPYEPKVDIEFSPDGTKWTRRATLTDTVTATIPATRPGYWRAHYRGDRQTQPAISRAVYAVPS